MRLSFANNAVVAGAMLVAASLGACAPSDANATHVTETGKVVRTASGDNSALERAEADRAAAEQRAAAAEAKLDCERERQEASNQGAVVGGVTGAVIGSQVAGNGAKSEGGAIGAVAGVMAGRQIAKKDHRC